VVDHAENIGSTVSEMWKGVCFSENENIKLIMQYVGEISSHPT